MHLAACWYNSGIGKQSGCIRDYQQNSGWSERWKWTVQKNGHGNNWKGMFIICKDIVFLLFSFVLFFGWGGLIQGLTDSKVICVADHGKPWFIWCWFPSGGTAYWRHPICLPGTDTRGTCCLNPLCSCCGFFST